MSKKWGVQGKNLSWGLLPPSAPNKQYFSTSNDIHSFHISTLFPTWGLLSRRESRCEAAEVRHNTSGFGAQWTGLYYEGTGEALRGSELPRFAIQWVDYLVFSATSFFFSNITKEVHGWGHRKNYHSHLFLLMPRWGREWKLVAEKETFLMLTLAMKNG